MSEGAVCVCVCVYGINQSNTNQSLNQTWRSSFFHNGAVECKTKEQHWVQAIKLIKNVCKISPESAKGTGFRCVPVDVEKRKMKMNWKQMNKVTPKLDWNFLKVIRFLSNNAGLPKKFTTARLSSIMHKLSYFWALITVQTAVNLEEGKV